jgi:Flp pilus assembly protein TadD
MLEEVAAPPRARGVFGSAGFIIAVCVLLIAGAAGGWFAYSQRTVASAFDDGVAAYQRGAREVARIAFANAARTEPADERPLIFLGRLAREEGNLASARRFLDAAIKVAPTSPLALREMGAVLLADGNPELARRFYVRALQLDPTDRLAQGFLGCALHRLGRPDEAQRWTDRAGPGDWTPCLAAPAPAVSTPAPAR